MAGFAETSFASLARVSVPIFLCYFLVLSFFYRFKTVLVLKQFFCLRVFGVANGFLAIIESGFLPFFTFYVYFSEIHRNVISSSF